MALPGPIIKAKKSRRLPDFKVELEDGRVARLVPHAQQQAVLSLARFLQLHGKCFPGGIKYQPSR